MGLRRILAAVVGTLQAAIGAVAVILAYGFYNNFSAVQGLMNISEKNVPLDVLFLFVFGFVSIISGFSLIHERL